MSATKTPKAWFQFKAQTNDATVAEIHIIDLIGDWYDEMWKQFGYDMAVTAKSFVDELSKLSADVKTIRVFINSPGGDVFAGVNIANALRDQAVSKGRTVETHVVGVAASIASVIAMAGTKVVMADNALMMVHNPWSVSIGNAAEMRKTAATLDTITEALVASYQWHSKLSADELKALLDAETWLTADAAIAAGLATEKSPSLQAAASIDRRVLAKLKVPDQHRAALETFLQPAATASTPASATEILDACTAAGCMDLARELVAANLTSSEVAARVTAAKDQKATAHARATQITALCSQHKLPELAKGYIDGAMSIDQVKAHVLAITAKVDKAEIDATLNPDATTRPNASTKKFSTAAEIYAARNAKQ